MHCLYLSVGLHPARTGVLSAGHLVAGSNASLSMGITSFLTLHTLACMMCWALCYIKVAAPRAKWNGEERKSQKQLRSPVLCPRVFQWDRVEKG